MGAESKIQWTDHTFNPWWGCQRVSPGCEHCYAETFSKRVGLKVWGPSVERRFFGDKHWAEPLKWNRAAEKAGQRARVFCASMADVFEDRPELDAQRVRLWALIAATPALDWQLLTKRPQNMRRLAPWGERWPSNVWAGTTVEDQRRADERIAELCKVPAAVRFLSCEPLLGPVTLSLGGIHWVIVGGESGPGARSFDLVAARRIVSDCQASGVAVFVKQMGADPIDGTAGCSVWQSSRKGDVMADWPEELRVREMPAEREGAGR